MFLDCIFALYHHLYRNYPHFTAIFPLKIIQICTTDEELPLNWTFRRVYRFGADSFLYITYSPWYSDSSAFFSWKSVKNWVSYANFKFEVPDVQCHNCCIWSLWHQFPYLSLKFEMSIAHSFLDRFSLKKMRWSQKNKG